MVFSNRELVWRQSQFHDVFFSIYCELLKQLVSVITSAMYPKEFRYCNSKKIEYKGAIWQLVQKFENLDASKECIDEAAISKLIKERPIKENSVWTVVQNFQGQIEGTGEKETAILRSRKLNSVIKTNEKFRYLNAFQFTPSNKIEPLHIVNNDGIFGESRKSSPSSCVPQKDESNTGTNDKWRCQNTLQSKSNDTIVPSFVQEFERLIKASRKPMTGFRIPKKFESLTREANDKWNGVLQCQNTPMTKKFESKW